MNPTARDLTDLFRLLACHATPGDETEVAEYLTGIWQQAGLSVRRHGHYAISAALNPPDPSRPTLLVCAHMDSPGFVVECIQADRLKLVNLGGVRLEGAQAPGILKTSAGRTRVEIQKVDAGLPMPCYYVPRVEGAMFGDRVCFAGEPSVDGDGLVRSPFLDNRLGCGVLCELARRGIGPGPGMNVVLGATACEELGGFGAPVLARAIKPDLVVCVDSTYAAPEQDVMLGNGPVLTLSDASVLISCQLRDRIQGVFASAGIPLQTEIYNYSGTDSRAFPHQGVPATVLPLLLPTENNHTQEETGSLRDMEQLIRAIPHLARSAVAARLI